MSRIGNRVLALPENVTVTVDNNIVTVKGPKGELSTEINKNITVTAGLDNIKIQEGRVLQTAPGWYTVFADGR